MSNFYLSIMDGVVQLTTDTSFIIKQEPLEQQILPLLDQANKNNDIAAALKLIKVEALIQERDDRLRYETCVTEEADDKENLQPCHVEEKRSEKTTTIALDDIFAKTLMRAEVPMEITFREFKELRKNIGISKSGRDLLYGLQEYFLIDHSHEFVITVDLAKNTSLLVGLL